MRSGSRNNPPPTFFRYTLGAGQPRFKSIPAMQYSCNSLANRATCSRSSPISWANTGLPDLFSVIEERIPGSILALAWTRKYSVKNKSGGPKPAIKFMNGSPVTSCIGASAVGKPTSGNNPPNESGETPGVNVANILGELFLLSQDSLKDLCHVLNIIHNLSRNMDRLIHLQCKDNGITGAGV